MVTIAASQKLPTHTNIRDWLERLRYTRINEYHAAVGNANALRMDIK